MKQTQPAARRPYLIGLAIALSFAVVRFAGPDFATAQTEEEAVATAFTDFLNAYQVMESTFVASDTFNIDEAHKVGAYDLLTAFLNNAGRSTLSTSGTGRRGYPRFAGFDDPDTRIGIDNPDTQYMATNIFNASGQEIYRVFGNRTNTADFILTLFDTSTGTGGLGTLEDENMVFEADGSYEVFLSTAELRDPSWANWLEIPALDNIQVARRHSHCDWSQEVPGEVHVERLSNIGVPSGDPDMVVLEQQYRDAIAILETQAPFWPNFANTIKLFFPVNEATPWRRTAQLGITTQANSLMWFDLEDDEALIIRYPDEGLAGYYGVQISNFWGSSPDWANRHASLSWGKDGTCQAELSKPTRHPEQADILENGGVECGKQDAYFVVVSKKDPRVRNWIETSSLQQGIIAGRQQSVPEDQLDGVVDPWSCSKPTAFRVPTKWAWLGIWLLGGDWSFYGPNKRKEQLIERQDFARSKYVFW